MHPGLSLCAEQVQDRGLVADQVFDSIAPMIMTKAIECIRIHMIKWLEAISS